jgi:unsaturated rhamnogalacturonyl hydrolase
VTTTTTLRPFIAVFCLLVPAAGARAAGGVTVKVSNPLAAPRASETITVNLTELRRLAPALEPGKIVVNDDQGKPVPSQLVDADGDDAPDELVFQIDLGARQTRVLAVEAGQPPPRTRDDFKVYGRFVRERHDDFAWENDRIARRAYGVDLETWKKEPLVSSGIDVWCKRTRKLVVNDWYMVDDYHRDTGMGADLYSVGKSRGCGGSGVMVGDKLAVSRNFTTSRVLANGPIRLIFELGYPPFAAGAVNVSEVKRITLDAGKNFDRIESSYRVDGKPAAVTVGVGIVKHEGGTVEVDKKAGSMRTWEPVKDNNGNLGCGVVLAPGGPADYRFVPPDHLLSRKTGADGTFAYYAGFGWDRSGDFADVAAWGKAVQDLARTIASPVRVTLAARPATAGDKSDAASSSAIAWARRTADSVMKRNPTPIDRWHYDVGLVLQGIESVGRKTGDRRYLDFVKASVDKFVGDGGVIKGYDAETYNIDDINMGKVLFALFADSKDPADKERYRKALYALRAQMASHPRTSDGGFWHKKIYPHQIWADGVYMAGPFLAKFAAAFGEPAALDDAVKEVLLAETHLRDEKTGLLYHGWDERKTQRWANPATGRSSQLWGRGVGWYAMAVVDVLAEMPKNHPRRRALVDVLRRLAVGIARVQDPATGVWWQVLDAPGRPGNYKEASASAMFVYALAKGVKNGWLDPKTYGPIAQRGYAGVLNQFVGADDAGSVHVRGICKVAGLGGDPYRDGTYDYYIGTEVVTDDPKGVGAFLLASAEQG